MTNEKIVVLADQKTDRLGDVTKSLGLAGYQVSVVTTKDDLPDRLRREKPVLIIEEISKSDARTSERIIDHEKFGSIPVLVIGEIDETAAKIVETLNSGAAGYLKVPIEPLVLVKKITQLIERRRNEKIIGNQENYLRALIENGTDIITVITTEGTIIYESPSIEHLLGYKSNELVGRNCLEFIHSGDCRMVYEYYQESIRQNGFTQALLKYRFRHKNGSWRVLESACNFVTDDLEQLVIVVNSRDITRRRSGEKARERLENKLVEAEKRFKLALKTARMIWWEWNPQLNHITLADNFSEVYGAPEIKIAQEGFSLLHADDKERHTALVRKIAATGGTYHSEFRIIREDNGEIVWVEENASAFFDEKGRVQKVVGIAIDITERKKSENALRESEERFKAQYKGLPVPAYTWKKVGDDFVLADFNDTADRVARGTMPQYVGLTVAEVVPDLPEIGDSIRECFERKKSISFEMPYPSPVTNDTRQLIFDLVFIPPDSVMIYTVDVTEFRQTIDSLKTSENRFHLVSRATNDVLWDWNFSNDSLWWNENIFRVFGYREEDVSPKIDFWHENIHPDDAEKIVGGLKKSIDAGQNFWAAEYRFRQGDGSYAYVFDRGYLERDENGSAVRMIGAMMNITKRKWAEIELLESKDRLSIAQQVGNIGSFDLNIQTGKIITSKQLEEIYGAEPNFNSDFEYWLKFIHPDDVELARNSVKLAQDAGEFNYEFRIFSSDGKLHWLQCHLKTFYDGNRRPQRLVGVNMDITERKLAEEALQKSQEQLAQAQKLESVGRLAGGIAHDFNNMLTAINGYSELILRSIKNEDDPIRRKVVEIKKAGERSVDLTKQLLAFSRRQVLQPKLVDLNQVVADMSQLLKRLIGEDIQLTIELHKDACCIVADPGQISQVIMNLVVNARDAMPEGGKLKVETMKIAVDKAYAAAYAPMIPGEYVMLHVTDTGSGIDEETLRNIFEPFFTTKKSGAGTGLGLATVYGIVKQSGGYIWVESELGKGTNFKIFLPYNASPDRSEKSKLSEPRAPMGTETILFVEDEETVRNLTVQVLENYGYRVISAPNGIEALKICRNDRPKIDLLLTDVVMPQMSGHKLADSAATLYPHLKILFTSGYTDDKNLLEGLPNVEKDFIQKPFSADSLGNKVRNLLDRRGS